MKPFSRMARASMLALTQQRDPGFFPDWNSRKDTPALARKNCPYRQGDLVRFKQGDSSPVTEGLVVSVGTRFLEGSCVWIAELRVRPRRLDGHFAHGWIRIYPGDIGRAEAALCAAPRSTRPRPK